EDTRSRRGVGAGAFACRPQPLASDLIVVRVDRVLGVLEARAGVLAVDLDGLDVLAVRNEAFARGRDAAGTVLAEPCELDPIEAGALTELEDEGLEVP